MTCLRACLFLYWFWGSLDSDLTLLRSRRAFWERTFAYVALTWAGVGYDALVGIFPLSRSRHTRRSWVYYFFRCFRRCSLICGMVIGESFRLWFFLHVVTWSQAAHNFLMVNHCYHTHSRRIRKLKNAYEQIQEQACAHADIRKRWIFRNLILN